MVGPDPSLPRMLGRYALYEKIASGGMASVHIGRLLGPVGFARTVAIKRMHPQLAQDPEFVSMFLDEARLAARIRHPNVVPTLDVVAIADELFLVMDFVQGESLSRLIRAASVRGERIPPDMVATTMAGALHGLHAAHEAKSDGGVPLGIVHRDVSPHNILVGVDGVARVLDFGVAKAVGRLQTTRDGQLKGKLGYMAPEQVRGEVSRTTDVYAASVVLWEALTGKRLFRGDNEAQVLDRVMRGCDVPPSQHAAGLPPALDELTMRGLNVDPARRFATARDMARALEEAIPFAPVSRIGDWVEVAAKQTLDERSARIASIESDTSLKAPPQPTPEPSSGEAFLASIGSSPSGKSVDATPGPPVEWTPEAVTDDAIPTQLSSGSASSAGRSSTSRAGRRTVWLAAACGAGLLLIAGLVATVSRRPAPASPAASGTPARVSSPVMPVATPAPTAPSSPPAEPPASTAMADASSASSASGSAASAGPAGRPVRAPVQLAPAPATPPPSPAKPAYNPLEHL
jgi:eukaryotic-like serine/threonine-protein kinase